MTTRRTFLAGSLATLAGGPALARLAAAAPPAQAIRIGSCMIGLEEAKQAGLEGVEIRAARKPADQLEIADPQVRRQYKDQMRQTGLPVTSLMMGILNSCPLASDPRGPAWLEQCIDAAKDLDAKVILVAFFGKGSLLEAGQVKKADVDVVVRRLQAAAPRAQAAGVILAIENTLTAQQNAEILDRIGSPAVKIYYDVGNTTNQGYDVPAEIRFLKDRITIFHFKDNPNYLGEGKVNFPPIAAAVREIGYRGWIILETTSPAKNPVADAQRNAAFVRKLFDMA